MGHLSWRRLGLLLVLGVLAAVGVTASGPKPAPTQVSDIRVVMPGKPGEQARVAAPGQVKAPPPESYTAADVWFVRMMIPHHAQAIEMAGLADNRAANPQIAGIAGRIKAAQFPEILNFKAWLKARNLAETDTDRGHDHASMPGMQSPEAMRALAGAKGDQFDRMFAAMMTAHHQGAIDMAELRLRAEGDQMVEKMATEVAFEQSVEINRIRDILAGP